jgi:glycine hydroxymethyltransferase
MHIIAAKAVCLKEATQPGFRTYQQQVVRNAQALARALTTHSFRVISGGTDNHLFLVDVHSRGLTGSTVQSALDRAGITVNKNAIPFDPLPPLKAGGIRLGSPAVTTRGMREPEMERIAAWIAELIQALGDTAREQRVRAEVTAMTARFPLYVKRVEAPDGSHYHAETRANH